MPKAHRVRLWSENRPTISKSTGKPGSRMAYCWECWGPDCVKNGKPAGGASLFRSTRDDEANAHKES